MGRSCLLYQHIKNSFIKAILSIDFLEVVPFPKSFPPTGVNKIWTDKFLIGAANVILYFTCKFVCLFVQHNNVNVTFFLFQFFKFVFEFRWKLCFKKTKPIRIPMSRTHATFDVYCINIRMKHYSYPVKEIYVSPVISFQFMCNSLAQVKYVHANTFALFKWACMQVIIRIFSIPW